MMIWVGRKQRHQELELYINTMGVVKVDAFEILTTSIFYEKESKSWLGGGFKYILFFYIPLLGEMIQFFTCAYF